MFENRASDSFPVFVFQIKKGLRTGITIAFTAKLGDKKWSKGHLKVIDWVLQKIKGGGTFNNNNNNNRNMSGVIDL